MDIIGSRVGRIGVLALSGALDTSSAPALSVRAFALCDTDIRAVLIDLDQAPHLTSAGFRYLAIIKKRTEQTGIGMALCGLNELVHDLFEVSGFLGSFAVYPDRASALAALAELGAA
jgi:anti-anti-sigma factor